MHDRQHYELVDWRRADADLNYRRFFAINTLAGLRVEDERVFEATHALVRELLAAGWVDGLRIDHPDGLADPGQYLDRLAELSGRRWTVVEKILEPGEDLPEGWATAGTTGYDALAEVDGVLVDPAGEPALTALDTEVAGRTVDYAELVHGTKREVTDGILGSEVARLARLVGDLPGVPGRAGHRGPGRAAGLLRRLPHLPARGPGAPGQHGRRRPGPPSRPHRRGRRPAPAAGHPGHRAGHPLRADVRAGHGQGRGGQRLLPVVPVRRAQRGRRGPHPLRAAGGGLPRRAGSAGGAAAPPR